MEEPYDRVSTLSFAQSCLLENLPKYDGSCSSKEHITTWLNRVRTAFAVMKLPEKDWTFFSLLLMRGYAFNYALLFLGDDSWSDFDSLAIAMTKRFSWCFFPRRD